MLDPTALNDVELDVILEGVAELFARRVNGGLTHFDTERHETLNRLAYDIATEHRARNA